jgi:hypothetical protein
VYVLLEKGLNELRAREACALVRARNRNSCCCLNELELVVC